MEKIKPAIVYLIVALLVMAPLLSPGYVLTLDMVFVPNQPLPDHISSSYLFYALLHWLSMVIPMDIVQKMILLGIVFLSGLGAHRLTKFYLNGSGLAVADSSLAKKADATQRLSRIQSIKNSAWPLYFAGLFYAINPFVYSRFMVGQFAVLLGYALLPFFLLALTKLANKPNLKTSLILSALITAISIVSVHTLGPVIIATLFVLALFGWKYRHSFSQMLALVKSCFLVVTIWFIASSYWLIPLVLGKGSMASAVNSFNQSDYLAFATTGGNWFCVILNILRLQGFWAEAQNLFYQPQQLMPLWGLLFMVVLGLVVFGFIRFWRANQGYSLVLIGCAIVAIILAAGLFSGLPFFAAWREPHKFVGLLALSYAIAGAFGLCALWQKLGQLRFVATAGLLLPILITPTMIWGFAGQLHPSSYPHDWFSMNKIINNEDTGKVLFLPWHQYMVFGFAGKLIENPAPKFFDAPIVGSTNAEFRGVKSLSQNPTSSKAENLLNAPNDDLATNLAELNISHILLALEYDFADYDYIDRNSDFQLVEQTENLMLYRNLKWKAF